MDENPIGDLEKLKAARPGGSLAGEFWYLLARTKKWWLLPILISLLLLGLLAWMSGTAAAPFLYTLF